MAQAERWSSSRRAGWAGWSRALLPRILLLAVVHTARANKQGVCVGVCGGARPVREEVSLSLSLRLALALVLALA